MKPPSSFLIKTLVILAALGVSRAFDYQIFAQLWQGSYCETSITCCTPSTGMPAANFSIHGLFPRYKNGSSISYCDSSNTFNSSQESNPMVTSTAWTQSRQLLKKQLDTLLQSSAMSTRPVTIRCMKFTCAQTLLDLTSLSAQFHLPPIVLPPSCFLPSLKVLVLHGSIFLPSSMLKIEF
ncbi:PREDICTED: uncharacterized protein LOC104591840 isoform X1 [Nelumbo nucifera]|uniref:Uncharacterized protein LOC104591840 isoform X1 n=1 Tax=Nelumbo nucifera TaxID=4432 RepID=A0A1U7Z9H8_NELNU|nr:PREDICTED: uncharacterized protein LOC104591840 isoform X1 [Nelumbo nucifera]